MKILLKNESISQIPPLPVKYHVQITIHTKFFSIEEKNYVIYRFSHKPLPGWIFQFRISDSARHRILKIILYSCSTRSTQNRENCVKWKSEEPDAVKSPPPSILNTSRSRKFLNIFLTNDIKQDYITNFQVFLKCTRYYCNIPRDEGEFTMRIGVENC